jgi:DNA-binding sugar fermentation-stimulating protein
MSIIIISKMSITISNKILMNLNDLVEAVVIKRPSKYIKTPYVADVKIDGSSEEILAHTAALGCCGLADVGASILMAPTPTSKSGNTKQKCSHRIYLAIIKNPSHCECESETIVGIHPQLGEQLCENALKNNCLSKLLNITNYKRETTIYIEGKVDSRFDFTGVDSDGIPFIMEVKNVPLADYEDMTSKERKKMDFSGRDWNSKVAYFPDGYRKKSTEPVSPRALKHIRELTIIKKESKIRCLMCYVIQRTDVDRFTASVIDEEYREAVKEAINCGVEIITLVVKWTRDGVAEFVRDDLPIVF